MRGSAAWQSALCYATGFGVSTDWNEADKYFTQSSKLGSTIARRFQPILYRHGTEHTGEEYTTVICEMLSLDVIPSVEASWLSHNHILDPIDQALSSRLVRVPSNDIQTLDKASTTSTSLPPEYVSKVLDSRLEAAIAHKDCNEIRAIHAILSLSSIRCNEPSLVQGLRTRDWKVVQTLIACGLSLEEKDEGGRSAFHWLFMLDEEAPCFAKHCCTRIIHSDALDVAAMSTITIHPQWPLQLEGTPLAHAVAVGSRATVVALLSLGANPLAPVHLSRSEEGWTSLHVAVKYHRPDILKILLGATKTKEDIPPFYTPLAVALCYSSVLERISMHGRHHVKHLQETIALLGPSEILEEASPEGVTALMRSLESNDVQVTAALLQRNEATATIRSISPNPAEEPEFHYPIHHAAQLASCRDDLEVLKILELIKKYDTGALSRLDSHCRTPLHLAASGSSSRAVAFLVKHNSSLLLSQDVFGARPLHYCESATIAEQLVMLGAEVNALDHSGRSPLCYAVTKRLGTVVRLLCKLNATTNMCVGSPYSPLHIAIINAAHEITTTLIAFGASVNLQDHSGNTPLHVAARNSPRHILRLLLDNGANALILNDQGVSALHVAAQSGNNDALDILSDNKPELTLKPEDKTTNSCSQLIPRSPLYICMEKFNTRAVNLMLPRLPKLDAEKKDSTGRNILHYAAEATNIYLVEGLIRIRVDLDARNAIGDTALTLAVRSRPREMKRPQLCRMLIENGASVTAQNDAGEMTWDIAVNNIQAETQDDLRCVLEILLLHSVEACRRVTRQKKLPDPLFSGYDREPYGRELVHFAFNRPDRKLLKALKVRMPLEEFNKAEAEEVQAKEEQDARAAIRVKMVAAEEVQAKKEKDARVAAEEVQAKIAQIARMHEIQRQAQSLSLKSRLMCRLG
jgi:ankyrin repeat protein